MRNSRIAVMPALLPAFPNKGDEQMNPVEEDGGTAERAGSAVFTPHVRLVPRVNGEKGKRPGEGKENALGRQVAVAKGGAQKNDGGHRDAMERGAEERNPLVAAGGYLRVLHVTG